MIFNLRSLDSTGVSKQKSRLLKNSLLQYPEPDSNRHASEDIGVWDQRVYQFRHRGILIGGQSYVKFCLIQNIKTIKAPKIAYYP